ncbi:Tripartite tricarboxylate transporter TctA family [Oligella urethralis]|uniref:tripartite tricarboxylate transporter permease n=1 Tax=Oligella urethralis TaxID=90245 RepID=UPI000E016436|nr:tripartite tricarboxylate transporter permease [Oligella urethralis]SUA60527.1 Tripartite tricarboxylate transporter TctA family [Oligella urethralis]
MLEDIFIGLTTTLAPAMLLAIFIGSVVGVVIGMLPGLTSTMGVALLIPMTFVFPPEVGLALLGGVYVSSTFSGAISAILLNIPGTPSAVATCWDGYPMTQMGKGGRAIGFAVFASCIGGLFSTVVLLFMAPVLSELSLMLGAPEYFLFAVFGVTIIASVSEGKLLPGLIVGILGLIISMVGMHPMTGEMRLTLGLTVLYDGLPLVIALIGLYSIPEAISLMSSESRKSSELKVDFSGGWQVFKDTLKQKTNLIRSSLLGTIVGIVPGVGQSITSFIAYDMAKKASKEPEKFGKGAEEGIVASETANNAVTGGSLVPLLTLGIPGNAVTAVLLGGLTIHGLSPGPALFEQTPDIAYGFIFSLFLSNLAFVPIGLLIAYYGSRVIFLPKEILASIIIALAIIGAFSIRSQVEDIGIMLIVGVIGYVFMILNVSRSPLVLGLVLGSMAESNFSRALLLSHGSFADLALQFITRPMSVILILLCVLSIYFGLRTSRGNRI